MAKLLSGRDAEWKRWLGPGTPEPAPTACIVVDDQVVGWVDAGTDQSWLQSDEVNIGYNVFPEHRRRGYARRGVQLLLGQLRDEGAVARAYLVIETENAASLAVAAAISAVPVEPRAELERPNRWFQIDLRATKCQVG